MTDLSRYSLLGGKKLQVNLDFMKRRNPGIDLRHKPRYDSTIPRPSPGFPTERTNRRALDAGQSQLARILRDGGIRLADKGGTRLTLTTGGLSQLVKLRVEY